jgi:hypothetical protein
MTLCTKAIPWGKALTCLALAISSAGALAQLGAANVRISEFATGFDDPRGIKFGPDGYLYVSEAGHGGNLSTAGLCQQSQPPGPVTGGFNARISKVSPTGQVTVMADRLPSSIGADGNTTYGIADVAFVRGELFAILQGGGCAHGHADIPLSLIKVQPDGTWRAVADLGNYIIQHPVKGPPTKDLDPVGTWNALIEVGGKLYAVEANHGVLEEIDPVSGSIRRIKDLTEVASHPIPTSVAFRDLSFYVSTLGRIPLRAGEAKVWRVEPGGVAKPAADGMSGVVSVAYDGQGRLLVLETTTVNNAYFEPFTGKLKRLTFSNTSSGPRVQRVEELVTGLNFPTSLTFAQDGRLFLTVNGHRSGRFTGKVLSVQILD